MEDILTEQVRLIDNAHVKEREMLRSAAVERGESLESIRRIQHAINDSVKANRIKEDT